MYNLIEKAFYWLAYSVLSMFAVIIFLLILMPAKVTFYSLSENQGLLKIQKHVDWSQDDYIPLDRSVTCEQAIQMVKELNETIK